MAVLSPGCREGGPVMGLHDDTPIEDTAGSLPLPTEVAAEPVPQIHGPQNIAAMKQQIVEYQRAILLIGSHIRSVEQNLDALNPAAVCAVFVPNYTDPPARVDAAKVALDAATPSII